MENKVGFRRKYTTIKGISTIRRLTWKGKIRLGIKVQYGKDAKGNPLYRPKETDYFVCPKEVKAFYGEQPKKLSVMFPLNDMESIFPQAYKFYGKSKGLKCSGDGVDATFVNDKGEMENRKCPCENLKLYDPKTKTGGCSKRGTLLFFIPAISLGAVYAMDFSSFHSIVDVQSGIALAQEMLKGRIAMVPFTLSRVQKETHNEGKKQIHWTLQCELAIKDPEEIKRIREGENIFRGQGKTYEIEERKEDINPAYDSKADGAVIKEETEEETKAREEEVAKKQDGVKKDFEESKAKEAQLKKDQEEGKSKIKSYKESKSIYKKRVEEEKEILLTISEKAKKAGIDNFEKLVKFAVDMGIFKTMLNEDIARKVLITNKDVYNRLMKALEKHAGGDKEKLDKMFKTLKEAGLPTWKEIAYFACLADLIEPGTAVEDVKMVLLKDSEAVDKIIKSAKIEEEQEVAHEQKIADEDIPYIC